MVHSLNTEGERLALIRSLDLLTLTGAPELSRLTELASQFFEVPTVLISIVGEEHQHFIGSEGFDLSMTDRASSICAHAIREKGVFEINDLALDARFSDNELVVDGPRIRFYAGSPLVTSSGYAVGTLCLIDRVPRTLTDLQRRQLESFSTLVMDQISLLRSVGRRDPITGLPNRQQFNLDLDALVDSSPRERHVLAIMDVFDIHSAHALGQALGMPPVESIIRQVGDRLGRALSDVATLYHVGVTRFAFVLTDISLEEREALLERIRLATALPVRAGDLLLQPMCHGGLTAFDATNANDALRKAIVAMHQALELRQAWVRYEPMRDAKLRRDYRLASDLLGALDSNELYLVYQPRISLATGAVVGVEALLRWKHHELGDVSPAEFVPVIERTALMGEVTDWVLGQAMSQIKTWEKKGYSIPVAVNVTPSDFNKGDLPQRIANLCNRWGISTKLLEVEITEGEWLEKIPEACAQLSQLRTAGVRVAIDDFGAGYSNFAYLTSLPIDTLKIDRSLVAGFKHSHERGAMVRAIISLAHDLSFKVVAEGVEAEEEAIALAALGCEEAQGYFFSRPVSPQEVLQQVLRRQSWTKTAVG